MVKHQDKLGIAFSKRDVTIVDVRFSSTGNYTIRRWAEITRETRDDIDLATTIKRVLGDEGFLPRHAAISLQDPELILRKISIPKLSKNDIKKLLIREIKKELGKFEDEIYFDFLITNARTDDDVQKMDILYLAAPRELVIRYTDIVTQAGLTPTLFIPGSMAMSHLMNNSMDENGKEEDPLPVSLIYLGEEKTSIVIKKRDQTLFSREIHLSLLKRVVPSNDPSEIIASNGWDDESFDDAIREIKRTLLYCKKDVLGKEVSKILIASEQMLPPDQIDKLQSKMGIATIQWQLNKPENDPIPKNSLKNPLDKPEEKYLFATGTAAASTQKRIIQIIPRSLRMKRLDAVLFKAAVAFSLVLFFGGLGSYFTQQEKFSTIMALHSARKEMASLAESATLKIDEIISGTVDQKKMEILRRLRQRHPRFQKMFQSLSQLMPPEAVLTKVDIERKKERWVIQMHGVIVGENIFKRINTFSKLVDHLEHSDSFFGISMTPIENQDVKTQEMAFQIQTYFL
ncbi:MAG: pilus assembly protein PilM [Nitrospiria bacterium]